jgi:D-alanyl-D-alanine carboxypeptidase
MMTDRPHWLEHALAYIPRFIEHQMELSGQPGCSLAVAYRGEVVHASAYGLADARRGERLTPRHRFRVASHSKTFAAAAALRLQEQGRWRLDDAVGTHVSGLPRALAGVTLAQLLAHAGGVIRDGQDAGQWGHRRPFLNADALRADLQSAAVVEPHTRFKYSNHGYGLLGLALQAATGETFNTWVAREIVKPAGLKATLPDAPADERWPSGTPLAQGHSAVMPVGQRLIVPSTVCTHAMASATGFISTASDLATFYASLDPAAESNFLSVSSRRQMAQRLWRDAPSSIERHYGLGCMSGSLDGTSDWQWWGHSGGFPGTITRTTHVSAQQLTVSVLTNAGDGMAHTWGDAVLHILRVAKQRGAPSRRTAPWGGRWWSLWGAADAFPVDGDRVLIANPALAANPFVDAQELRLTGANDAVIDVAGGFFSPGETAQIKRDAKGRTQALRLGGTVLKPRAQVARELQQKFKAAPARLNNPKPRRGR